MSVERAEILTKDRMLIILRHLKGLVRELERMIEETERAATNGK